MSGGIEIYEKYLNEKQFRPIAMQVLAAGALRPKEAIEYLGKFPGCFVANDSNKELVLFTPRNDKNPESLRSRDKSVLFGASSKELPRGTIRDPGDNGID